MTTNCFPFLRSGHTPMRTSLRNLAFLLTLWPLASGVADELASPATPLVPQSTVGPAGPHRGQLDPDPAKRSSLDEIMAGFAKVEQASMPYHIWADQIFNVSSKYIDRENPPLPWADGHEHMRRMDQLFKGPHNWTRKETLIVDGAHVRTDETTGTLPDPLPMSGAAIPVAYDYCYPLVGVFPLTMVFPSEETPLLSAYYKAHPEKFQLSWDDTDGFAKLDFDFAQGSVESHFELWLSPGLDWHPVRMHRSLPEPFDYEETWIGERFISTTAGFHVLSGKVACLQRPEPMIGSTDQHAPIPYDIEFVVTSSTYGASVDAASDGSQANPSPQKSTSNTATVHFRPNSSVPASQLPSLLELLKKLSLEEIEVMSNDRSIVSIEAQIPETQVDEYRERFARSQELKDFQIELVSNDGSAPYAPPATNLSVSDVFFKTVPLTIEASDFFREKSPVKETLELLQKSVGPLEFSDGSDRLGKPVDYYAEIHAKPDVPAESLLLLVKELGVHGIHRMVFSPPNQSLDNRLVIVCPADVSWRQVQMLQKFKSLNPSFSFDVRIAGSNDPVETVQVQVPMAPVTEGPAQTIFGPVPTPERVKPVDAPAAEAAPAASGFDGGGFGGGDFGGNGFGMLPQSAIPGNDFVEGLGVIVTVSEDRKKAYGYSQQHPRWVEVEFTQQAEGVKSIPIVSGSQAAIQHGTACYAYSAPLGIWDTLQLPAGEVAVPAMSFGTVQVNSPSQGEYLFLPEAGKWFSANDIRNGKVTERMDELQLASAALQQRQIRFFSLSNSQAALVAATLKAFFKTDSVTIADDERTNSVIVQADEKVLEQIKTLIEILDAKTPDAPKTSANPPGIDLFVPAEAPVPADIPKVTGRIAVIGTNVEDLREQYHLHNNRSRELAARLKQPLASPIEGDKLQQDLRREIMAAFEARQKLQQAEVAELAKRLQSLQSTLQLRERLTDQIIDRRILELLNPALDWNDDLPAASPPAPIFGSPINLPGPPHIPLGAPAATAPATIVAPSAEQDAPQDIPPKGISGTAQQVTNLIGLWGLQYPKNVEAPVPVNDQIHIAVNATTWAIVEADHIKESYSYRVDEEVEPHRIWLSIGDEVKKRAIYRITGDELAWCFANDGEDFPATFATERPEFKRTAEQLPPAVEQKLQERVPLTTGLTTERPPGTWPELEGVWGLSAITRNGQPLGNPPMTESPMKMEIIGNEMRLYLPDGNTRSTYFDYSPGSTPPIITQFRWSKRTGKTTESTGPVELRGDSLLIGILPTQLKELAPRTPIDHPEIMVQVWKREKAIRPMLSLQMQSPSFGTLDYVSGDANVTITHRSASLHSFGPESTYFQFRDIPNHPDLRVDVEVKGGERNAMATVSLSNEDLERVVSGETVTRIFYLPSGAENETERRIETLLSSKLDPALDPFEEVAKRGTTVGVMKLSRHAEQ